MVLTKQELSQLYFLRREIEDGERRLEELKLAAAGKTSRITGMPPQLTVKDCTTKYAADIAGVKEVLQESMQKCWRELKRLYQFINEIPDSQMRQIFVFRYLHNYSWQKIAFLMGEHDESYARRKHNQYLKLPKKPKAA